MKLAERCTNASLRWRERSIKRRFHDDEPLDVEPESDDDPDEDDFQVALTLVLGARPKDQVRWAEVRARMKIEEAQFELTLDLAVRFFFDAEPPEPDDTELSEFLGTYAVDYLFGYLRAGMADAARSVGLPAPMLPLTAIDKVRAVEVPVNRHE